MPTEKKVETVKELTDLISRSTVVIGADYRGLRVGDVTALRRQLRERASRCTWSRTRCSVAPPRPPASLTPPRSATGQRPLFVGFDDPLAPIKTVVEYQRTARNTFAARKAYLDGQIYPASRLTELATLPPREHLIAEFAGALQSPITTFVYLIQATIQEFSGLHRRPRRAGRRRRRLRITSRAGLTGGTQLRTQKE